MTFASDTAVVPSGDAYTAEIHDGWDIGGNANGGYLMALGARAMATASRPHPVAVNAHFLYPGRPGPISMAPHVLKHGKRFSTVRTSLSTAERNLVELLGSFAELAEVEGPVRIDAEPPELPAPEDCITTQRLYYSIVCRSFVVHLTTFQPWRK